MKSYWASDNDPRSLAEEIQGRSSRFYRSLRQNRHWVRVARSWLYYHGYFVEPGYEFDWNAVKTIADGVLAVGMGHYRNLIEHIYTLVTQQRLSFEVRSKTSSPLSLDRARRGKAVVNDYLHERGLEKNLKRSVRHALVMSQGFLHMPWDPWSGEQSVVEMRDGTDDRSWVVWQGEFSFSNPSVWDVVYDPGLRDLDLARWVAVRTWENRYDVAATLDRRSARARVLDERLADASDEYLSLYGLFALDDDLRDDSDIIPIWNFYHRESPAIPDGVMFRMTGGGEPLGDPSPLPYRRIPLLCTQPAEVLFTSLGYTQAFDLQAPQELLNAEVSLVATNHSNTSHTAIWSPDGCKLQRDDIGEGLIFLKGGDKPPSGINFNADSPGHERFHNLLSKSMEIFSGVNATARGVPETSFESGEALKVMDAKAAQSATPLKESYAMATEEAGTFILRTLYDVMDDQEERPAVLISESDQATVGYITRDDLSDLDRVVVDIANPILETVSGKMWLADLVTQRGLVTLPQELLTVIRSGSIEPLLKADEAQLKRVHEENERLKNGEPVSVDHFTDNHALDIREHAAVMASMEARGDKNISSSVLAHMTEHFQAMANPMVQWAMQALGFPVVPPPQVPFQPQVQPGERPSVGRGAPALQKIHEPAASSQPASGGGMGAVLPQMQ